MAKAEELLADTILALLIDEPQGLDTNEIIQSLSSDHAFLSARGIRNFLNQLEQEGKLIKRKRWRQGPGAPSFAYFHPNVSPQQLDLFRSLGVSNYHQASRDQIEKEDLEPDERERQAASLSVLQQIAVGHVQEDSHAGAIIKIAPEFAAQNPVELLVRMARWVCDDLNRLGDEIRDLDQRGKRKEADERAGELEIRLAWAKRYFRRFWRLPRTVGEIAGALDLPARAKEFLLGQRARLDEAATRVQLKGRIYGDAIVAVWEPQIGLHKAAVGTDASVADIFLEHSRGSFIPPDPVVVTTAAAALRTKAGDELSEYQDFDIFPDKIREYGDHEAAVKGLVLSPLLKRILPEQDFKHSRMAAMELRQYYEDLRVLQSDANWRPLGSAPLLGILPKPSLLFRDGRVFPLVHRIKDYEDDGLYGQIVRSQIERFAQVINHTLSGLNDNLVYGAAVKNPEMSWLAPLAFWYLHRSGIKGTDRELLVTDHDVYKSPFSDTAVAHLLFLGCSKETRDFSAQRLFVTCRAVRRFSDIAVEEETSAPAVITERGEIRLIIDENKQEHWREFVQVRVKERRERRQDTLDTSDYATFTYLCAKMGVSMCYASPTSCYQALGSGEGEHFLLPRLEVAIDMGDVENDEPKRLGGLLSWLASGGWDLDFAHTQSGFDTGDRNRGLPVLVPDVITAAHNAVTFARTKLGEEVQDELRLLISELRKRAGRS